MCARVCGEHPVRQHREKLAQEHRILRLVDRYHARAKELVTVYEDAKGYDGDGRESAFRLQARALY